MQIVKENGKIKRRAFPLSLTAILYVTIKVPAVFLKYNKKEPKGSFLLAMIRFYYRKEKIFRNSTTHAGAKTAENIIKVKT